MKQDKFNNQPSANQIILSGVLERVVYTNAENGYSVVKLRVSGSNDILTVTGNFTNPSIGTYYTLRGSHKSHPKYGEQFSAQSAAPAFPSTPDDIERYLASGIIKGIGDKTAERLVRTFGEKTYEVLENEPEKIAAVKGIGAQKAKLIADLVNQHRAERDVISFLLKHGISSNMAHRIFKRYGFNAIERISKDPYQLARDIDGVGFSTADSIAASLGIAPNSPARLKAGVIFALEKASEGEGHCYLPIQAVLEKTRTLLKLAQEIEILPHLNFLAEEGRLRIEGEAVYLPFLATAEEFVAKFAAGRSVQFDAPRLPMEEVYATITEVERELKVSLSAEQQSAVKFAALYPLMIVTGGPGCGKTTVVKALARLYKRANKSVRLAAPTGRAAQRLSQVCELPASTIHRLLKYDPISHQFSFGFDQPLAGDLFIIDEASMIDIQLAMSLFAAIPKDAVLILVGDKDQLPSVGPGRVLGDLLACRQIKSIALTQLFRRNVESTINSVAHMINCGQVPHVPVPDGNTKADAYFIPREAADAALTIEKLVTTQIPEKFSIAAADISVLTPSNRGPLGAIALNQQLQSALNPQGNDPEQELTIGDTTFRQGDRVVQRVNNYNIDEAGIFNGDPGVIYSISKARSEIIVEVWDGRLIKYTPSDATELALGYAMTVHRSQGSEIPCVVLALHDQHYTLLERQLIYTAVTRAKKLLIIVGSKRAFAIACRRTNTGRRCTRLHERIQELATKAGGTVLESDTNFEPFPSDFES